VLTQRISKNLVFSVESVVSFKEGIAMRKTAIVSLGICIGLAAALFGLWVGLLDVSASPDQPKMPHIFYGAVWIDGAPAPIGTVIEGQCENVITGTDGNPITTVEIGRYGNPGVTPPEDLLIQGAAKPPIPGDAPIRFYVDGARAECREVDKDTGEYIGGWVDTYPWTSGGETELNLRVFGQYTLTVFSGGCCVVSVTVDSSVQSIPPQESWTMAPVTGGLTVTLQAFDDPGAYCTFDTWSGDLVATANPVTFNVRSNMVITATALQEFRLTIHETGSGEGSVLGSSSPMTYSQGTVITLTAVPSPTSVFDGWGGDVAPGSSDDNPLVFAMDSDKEITATFEFYDVAVSPSTSQKMGDPGGDMALHRLEVTNTGGAADTYDVTAVSSNGWSKNVVPSPTLALAPSGSNWVYVEVQVPSDAAACATNVTTLTLTSQGDPRQSAASLLTTGATGECYFYDLFLPLVRKNS
jgi:hypothetical protein